MRFLLSTYSAAGHSSYGIVTRNLWRRLLEMNPKWEVHQQGWFHRGGTERVPWAIEPTATAINPTTNKMALDESDIHGQKTFEEVVSRVKPDVVWSVGDPYMMKHMGQYKPRHGFRLVKHCPADGSPQPPEWRDVVKDCDLLSPITRFAARMFHKYFPSMDLEDLYSTTIHHGVDTDIFRPVPADAKPRPEAPGIGPNTFLLGYNGFMQYRKQPWNLFLLLRLLLEGAYTLRRDTTGRIIDLKMAYFDDVSCSFDRLHKGDGWMHGVPQDVALWVHTPKRPSATNTHSVDDLMEVYGVKDKVVLTKGLTVNSGIPDREMPVFYQALDAYLSLSGGEGFCLPIIEAFACGIPVVYTDYSGQAEIGGYAGLPVRPYVVAREIRTNIGRAIADIEHAAMQVLTLIEDKNTRDACAERGVRVARETFDWNIIAGQWNKLLHSRLKPRKVITTGISI